MMLIVRLDLILSMIDRFNKTKKEFNLKIADNDSWIREMR